jgi:hypothetical protein
LSAYFVYDIAASRSVRQLVETYLAGNRAANKAVLRKVEDAARWFGATYELFYRAHRAGASPMRNKEDLARVLVGMLHYRNIQNEVRLFRYDDPSPALWQIGNSIFRHATSEDVHRLPVLAPHAEGRTVTVESEYASLLMLARLSTGSFTAQEIEHASTLLAECADRLTLEPDEPAHATFAIDSDSLTGLVSAHGFRVTPRTLFLDPEPLFAHIRERLDQVGGDQTIDPLARQVRLAWLERLLTHWVPDRKVVSRRAERQPADVPVALVPGLHNIHRELLAEMENAGEFWDTLIRSGRWKIIESSELDCRVQFENESAEQFPVGALISLRREGSPDWQVGVVRRVRRYEGNRTELGVELIAHEVKAIRLWPEGAFADAVKVGKGPEVSPMVALYLPSSGTIPPAPPRTLILRQADFRENQSLIHIASDTRSVVKPRTPIEMGRGWVWSSFTVESRAALDKDDPLHFTRQGMTTRFRPIGPEN